MDRKGTRSAAEAIVNRMLEAYNAHDVEALVRLFGAYGSIEDQAWKERHQGGEALRKHFSAEFRAAPDIRLDERQRHVTEQAIIIESTVHGTHRGTWRGLPPTGNLFHLHVYNVVEFDADDTRIAELRIHYDRARLLEQLGLLHDLGSTLGKTVTALSHPMTIARAAARRISERPRPG